MRCRVDASQFDLTGDQRRPAITLLELLIVIAVVAVVIALTVAALRPARESTIAAKCLVNARTCTTGILAYANDYDDRLPWFAERRRLQRAFYNGAFNVDYFLQATHWPLVARSYLSDDRFLVEAQCPAAPVLTWNRQEYLSQYPESYVPSSGYWLTLGAFSDPAWWNEGPARQAIKPPQWVFRPVRVAEVAFPADKALLVERHSQHSGPEVMPNQRAIQIGNDEAGNLTFSIVTADGSAALRRPATDLLPAFRQGTPALETFDGISGRDIRR